MFSYGALEEFNERESEPEHHELVVEKNPALEHGWQRSYETRKEKWKKSAALSSRPAVQSSEAQQNLDLLADGSNFRSPLAYQDVAGIHAGPLHNPELSSGTQPSNEPVLPPSIDDVITEYTLNMEQSRAFRLIAEHSLEKQDQPLRMFLGGPGGTGISRVINALTDFFTRRSQERRFRLASYTGVAARNISGMTLHAALNLGQK
ncbi:hypothetical protein B0H19DRAFT_952724, partial [Mycena capillaripes]